MLPPFSAQVAVEKACPRAGATRKHPIDGIDGRRRVLEPGNRLFELRGQRLPCDRPDRCVAGRQVADSLRIDDIGGDNGPRPAGGADRRHPDNLDLERIARLRARDGDRTVHRVRAGGAFRPSCS